MKYGFKVTSTSAGGFSGSFIDTGKNYDLISIRNWCLDELNGLFKITFDNETFVTLTFKFELEEDMIACIREYFYNFNCVEYA